MSRPKGSKNRYVKNLPPSALLSSNDRIIFLANIIIDRLKRDQVLGRMVVERSRVE